MSVSDDSNLIAKLTRLNQISETLNRAVDVRSVLDDTLASLVEMLGLETGWIFVKDPAARDPWWGMGYILAAHRNLPPAMELDNPDAWQQDCVCQGLCDQGLLTEAYNEVQCSRLAAVRGDRRGLVLHASVPLRSGDHILGILNVAVPDWTSFSPEALALLTNVGNQIGVALERARLFDLLQEEHYHEQETLLAFSDQLLSRLDLDSLIGYLVDEVRALLRVDACALLLPWHDPDLLGFRAASGWQVDPVVAGRQVPINEESSPGWVMNSQRPLVVEDIASLNPVPSQPDWLLAEGFRGHAVVPLVTGGHSVGVLMINSRQPLQLSAHHARLLLLMANEAAIAIEKARFVEQELEQEGMERELALGRQIQLSLLPQSPPVVEGWEFATYYQAARIVGGDFYDFFDLPGESNCLGMVIADAAGKGVPAALFMALGRTMIRTTALSGLSPAAALARASELIVKDSRSDLFLTVFYAMLDTQGGYLTYANGGHNHPLWLDDASGQVRELKAPGVVVGALPQIELEDRSARVGPGDLLVFYTDGVTEAMDADYQLFGMERLRDVLAAQQGANAQAALDSIVQAVMAHTGGIHQSDDMTLFVIRRCPL